MTRTALLLLTAILWQGCSTPGRTALDTFGTLPDFILTERSGQPVTRAALAGQVWVANFIFTNCAGTCPMMTAEMRRLQGVLPGGIRLLSFSVDPERDTPEVLRTYAQANGADPARWLFATGTRAAIYTLCKDGFKLGLDDTQGTPAEPITHSTRFVLVDRASTIRGYYDATDPESISRLEADALSLLAE